MKPTLVIPGGSGYMGGVLADYFRPHYRVVVLTRGGPGVRDGVEHLHWNGETLGDWAGALEGADVVVNLAGRSVNCRYTARNRRDILESRVRSTRVLGEAMQKCSSPPKLWVQSASATIYRHAEDRPMDERTGEIGKGFSVEVCRAWEREFYAPQLPHTRRVCLRTAMLLGDSGGVLPVFRLLVRLGLSGPMAGGRQFISWMHDRDFCRMVEWLIERPALEGTYNASAPEPLPNREFFAQMRHTLGVPFGLPSTRPMLELGAYFLQTETELLLKSRRVVPTRALEEGFTFQFPTLEMALEDLG